MLFTAIKIICMYVCNKRAAKKNLVAHMYMHRIMFKKIYIFKEIIYIEKSFRKNILLKKLS